jgi:capsular polysaccharide transport system permease protein
MALTADRKPRTRRFRTSRTIVALILREMVTTYGRSPGGYLWAVIEPVAALALLSVVFSLIVHSPPLGTDFALFYATGVLPFLLYSDVTTKVSRALRFSRPLLHYPGVRFLDAVIARFILALLTHLTVFIVIMLGLHLIFDPGTILDAGAVVRALALAALLGLGLGTFNCVAILAVPIWEQAWSIVNRPMFIVSGILFIYEDVPAVFRDIAWLNPVLHVIGLMRRGFFATYDASWASDAYVLIWALVPLLIGLLVLRRSSREVLANW